MTNTDVATKMLWGLRNLDVTIALDDFGTGYSSLSYLKRFPVDTIKIDRSFVADIETDKSDVEIIRAILAMAQSLGLKVVAEGVENETQLNFLALAGCNEYQGYFFSQPLSATDATELLHSMKDERGAYIRHG
jgi:EAL domain-containing protein (putative c-di-GMP-specific phosphodiesterase class I)